MHKSLRTAIENAGSIAIYRHVSPDMDAIGSQMGLKHAIETIWPDKQVYVIGERSDYGAVMDDLPAKNTDLAILLDISTGARVDGKGWDGAKHTFRVDHHVPVEVLAQEEWIEPEASATAQLLAEFFQKENLNMGSQAAQWLYQALTADNIRYTTTNTTPASLRAGAFLMEQGADLQKADLVNFGIGWQQASYDARIWSKVCRMDNFAFAVMEADDYLGCGLDFYQAKSEVKVFSGIEEISVWALFTRMRDGIHYSGSLRSRGKNVRLIAEAFGGGGHDSAAGLKNLDAEAVHAIVQQCAALSRTE